MYDEESCLAEAAEALGLIPSGNGWYGPDQMYGIERSPDGMVRAVAKIVSQPSVGVTDRVAVQMVFDFCPWPEDIQVWLDGDCTDSALSEAAGFVRTWNFMAEGTANALSLLTAEEDPRLPYGRVVGESA